ncbi:hypothetical protein [Massilia sp. CF038]|uniref:hypothetical protein n=1 Tax=Massilia sp. CF038 TaxID=1881045 RepID=UPI00091EA560|nr:hypothetical protein [Massilia sp. CF038]SHH16797.1 hypothetical protein SAMN05428948_3123 [Massilia sp. CF038]
MNASKLFAAVATLAFAGAAFAGETPAAAAATTTAAAQVTVAAQAATAAAPADKAGQRDKVKAEAVEAMNNRRATEASQYDWFMK